MYYLLPVLSTFCENFIFKFVMRIWPTGGYPCNMLRNQAFRVVLAESAYRETEFKLAQPFLFGLSSVIYQIKPHMETIGYEISLLILD
jgi:hypothetical protein